tara:strand:- start:815 stop:1444 length:630 start_codon:yes stop_codon:yes gene_type:complete
MHALIENNEITKYFNNPKGFTLGEVQYPSDIFMKWSTEEKQAIGIYEVVFDDSNKKDEKWYINTDQSFAFADGVVTASYGTATPKAHADSLYTSQDNTDNLIPSNKSVGDVKAEGLKTVLIRTLKQQVANELSKTDWYITRNAEKSTAIPSAISTHRDAVRTKQTEMETAIINAVDTPALETLYAYVNTGTFESPVIERPLGELPTLEL